MTLIEAADSGGGSRQGGGGGDNGGGDGSGAGAAGGSSAGVRMVLTTRDASKLTVSLRKCVKPFKVNTPICTLVVPFRVFVILHPSFECQHFVFTFSM